MKRCPVTGGFHRKLPVVVYLYTYDSTALCAAAWKRLSA